MWRRRSCCPGSASDRREVSWSNDETHARCTTYGAFARSFELPEGADAGSVKASFNNGVLTVTIGKAESAKPRKIEVKVA